MHCGMLICRDSRLHSPSHAYQSGIVILSFQSDPSLIISDFVLTPPFEVVIVAIFPFVSTLISSVFAGFVAIPRFMIAAKYDFGVRLSISPSEIPNVRTISDLPIGEAFKLSSCLPTLLWLSSEVIFQVVSQSFLFIASTTLSADSFAELPHPARNTKDVMTKARSIFFGIFLFNCA